MASLTVINVVKSQWMLMGILIVPDLTNTQTFMILSY